MNNSFLSSTLWCAGLIAASLSVANCSSGNDGIFFEKVTIETSAIVQEFKDLRNAVRTRIVGSITGFQWFPTNFGAADTVEVRCWRSFLLGRRPSTRRTSLSTR